MDLENKRLYSWLPWVASLLITGFFVLLLRHDWAHEEREWNKRLGLQQVAGQAALEVSRQESLRQAQAFAQLIAKDPAVVSLARQALLVHTREGSSGDAAQSALLRAQLQKIFMSYWEPMQLLGAHELNLHFGPSTFLRTHHAERFGDDVTPFRPLLISVLNSGKPASGIEVGRYGVYYRALVPIKFATAADDDTHINNTSASAPMAVLEVGLTVLPQYENSSTPKQGQAVLISAQLATDILWGSAQQRVLANSSYRHSKWYVESYNNPLVKEWQARGVLANLPTDNTAPWVISVADKSYLLVLLAGTNSPQAPLAASNTVILSWVDITAEQTSRAEERQFIALKCLSAWLLSLAVLWVLFYFNRRHVVQLLRRYNQELHHEHESSEQARQRLNLALASSASGFWEWNIVTNRSIFSKEWRELCGVGDDTQNDVEAWQDRLHPSDRRSSYNEMVRHLKGQSPLFESEYRVRVADGSYKWIFSRGKVVEWLPDGKAALMLGVYTDITERKKNEIIVIRQQAALRALNEIASVPVFDAEEQLRNALTIGARYLGLPCGFVSRVQGDQYHVNVSVGQKCQRTAIGVLADYFCEVTLQDKDVFCCDEIKQSEYANHHACKVNNIDTYIGVPIWLQGNIYGVLSFESEYSRHQIYDDLDKDFMRLLARWVSVTLERGQYQAEQQLLLDRFDKLCNQLPGFLYQYQLNSDGTSCFPFTSSGVEEIYGVPPEKIEADASAAFVVLHPDDLGWVSQTISTSAATLENWKATYRVVHPVRGEIWVRGEARPERLESGNTLWNGYVQDITEEKLAALKLQDINALREAIFDAASIAIIASDIHGVIKTFNKGAEAMLGYSATEVVDILSPGVMHLKEEIEAQAKILSHEFATEIKPGFDVFIARAREGDVDENEWTYIHKNGTHIPVILSVSALRGPEGEITGYLGLARDISELKRIDRMKSEFISTVSHELRTPLTAISGSLGIIVNGAAGAIPDTATKMLNIAHKNSLRLIHLVNDLLDMDKLNAGKMHFELKAQAIVPIVLQSMEANAAYAAQYHVKFSLDNTVRDDLRVTVDAQRLQQVLANFLSNACKFSPRDSTIVLRVEDIHNTVRVSVIDCGPGISEDFRGRIFQKFSQADSSDTRQKGGTGLGLAICKEIIERMGGKIGYTSEPGSGAQFYFDLPSEETARLNSPAQVDHAVRSERILVVEDDPEVAELFATILRAQQYQVDIAYSGQEALERLALYSYHALTLDIELPDMSGIELIKQMRSDATTQYIPIVVISANLDSEHLANRNLSMFTHVEWLQKPQTMQSILNAVKTAIAH
jgi:PAS domain S-box-containing protein